MAISLTFDIVLALICTVTIIRNAARGFIRSFVIMMKSVVAIFLAYLFNAPLARGISAWIFEDLSHGWVRDLMLSTKQENGGYALYQIFDGIPDWFTRVSVSQGIDKDVVQYYFVDQNLATDAVVEELSVPLGNALSMLISTVIAFIVIFVVVEILLIFIGKLLYRLGDVPIWSSVNIILGALMGAVISFLICWLLSKCIVFVFDFGANYYPDIFSKQIIEDTVLVEFFGNNNIFTTVKEWFS